MSPAVQLLAPLALLFPAAVAVEQQVSVERAPLPIAPPAEQVNIEQRVTIRINPRPAPMPNVANFVAEGADAGSEPHFVERKAGKCLPLGSIAGVQPLSDDIVAIRTAIDSGESRYVLSSVKSVALSL